MVTAAFLGWISFCLGWFFFFLAIASETSERGKRKGERKGESVEEGEEGLKGVSVRLLFVVKNFEQAEEKLKIRWGGFCRAWDNWVERRRRRGKTWSGNFKAGGGGGRGGGSQRKKGPKKMAEILFQVLEDWVQKL